MFQSRLAKALGPLRRQRPGADAGAGRGRVRIFLAQQRAASDAAVVTTLLREWLGERRR